MEKEKAVTILKEQGQRITDNRVGLLALLMDGPKAHSLAEIQSHLSGKMDRATVFRALNLFMEMGIVIKMVDSRGVSQYIFKYQCQDKGHQHVKCRHCHTVVCLPSLPDEYMHMINKYEVENAHFLMEGVCPVCGSGPDI